MPRCDFSGWATRNDLLCGDGRVIRKDAFKHNDGKEVSLVWNHIHDDPEAVMGKAILENRDEGVYAYCTFNDTESGKLGRKLVQHGDVSSLSIFANKLKQQGKNVIHGEIRELSLVLAGANPGAYIDFVSESMAHSDTGELIYDALQASYDENIMIHSDINKEDDHMNDEKTVGDVLDELNDEQRELVEALVLNAALGGFDDEEEFDEIDEDDDEYDEEYYEEGDDDMKHNVFDNEEHVEDGGFLSHADEEMILQQARECGSFKRALEAYLSENALQHDAFAPEVMDTLLPDYHLIDPKEPKILYPDDTWVASVMNGVHKSPYSRVRTRQADARQADLKAKGYKKAEYKTYMNKINLLGRTHDAQTVYIKDKLNRDDILDITDFDIVNYQWKIMRHTLDQTLATAILIGDGRDDLDPDKIKETHIRPIWHDDEMYCIHQDVDIAAAKAELQGSDTSVHFGDNYIYAEAIITAALYSREKYKGSGNLTFFCTPHLLNVMLLARDLNGRRIYSSKSDLVAALNVKNIQTVEQFEGLTRTTADGKIKKMLGLFVNLADYQLGCVKGGEISKFDQFDIDFNQQKLMLETRLSGALVEWYSAIALEEDVTTGRAAA